MNQMYMSVGGARGSRVILTPQARTFKQKVAEAIQLRPIPHKIRGRVKLFLRFWWADSRRRDLDNYLKLTIDSLKDVFFEDDDQIEAIYCEKVFEPRTNSGFEVHIKSSRGEDGP